MATTIRTIHDDEIAEYRGALMGVFGGDADDDPNGSARFRALIDCSQAWAAFDGKHIVATTATFNLEMAVPGGTLPMAGLTHVTVRPTHRRRGLLRELMACHLADAKTRGFAVSGLWASEAKIYRRFGYGLAAIHDEVTIQNAHAVNFIDGGQRDELAWIDEAEARAVMPGIYDAATLQRPGVLRRTATWWHERRFLEAPFVRKGASRRRHVLAVRGGTPVGYVTYRHRGGLGGQNSAVEIVELLGVDQRAEATLWQFVMRVDLFPTVKWSNAPRDVALPWMVDDWRHIARSCADNVWLRIEDVSTALVARRYAVDANLRFAVDGTTYELQVHNGQGQCVAVQAAAELTIDRAALGSLYLGSVPASQLAAAGWLVGDAAVIARAEALFAWPVAAWCPEIF